MDCQWETKAVLKIILYIYEYSNLIKKNNNQKALYYLEFFTKKNSKYKEFVT